VELKHILPFVGAAATLVCHALEIQAADASESARALIERIAPGRADEFVVETIPAADGKDVFELESKDGRIVLRGNNGVSIASAFNHYLKYSCNCDLSWCGMQMRIPKRLPVLSEKVRRVTPHAQRAFFNYCTFGYSMPWWGWPEWERAIDTMAMQGYNMPLAATGMEAIWYHTLLRFGFTDLEARSFLSAPGHLPWQLMQNLEGMDGPLPKSWIDSHAELGRKILQRERELGMTPIQQGFSGHVPHLLKQKYPQASIAVQPRWCNFPGVAQLDPLDPLFKEFGAAFIEEEIKLFGTDHRYAADPFHESAPPRPGADYLTAVGKCVFAVMTNVDAQATWIMQGWSNHREIVEAVPRDRLLILSIGGAGSGAYWGYPFLNCRYNNFGCRNNLHGDLKGLATNPFAAVVNAPNSNCGGTGLMMEGIFQNPVYLQLASDLIWRDGPVDAVAWLHDYSRRRYGAESANANRAWDLLLDGPYAPGTSATEYSSIIAARPALHCKKSGPNEGFRIPYPPRQLVCAWELLLKDRDRLQASDGYGFDVADIARQVLSNLGQALQQDVARAHLAKDKPAFEKAAHEFLELIGDVDTVCATRPEYHFGKWVAGARGWGRDDLERDLFERNASTLVTLWGPPDDPQIFDYAWREWAGLIGSYYRPRWEMFFAYLREHPDYREAGLPQVYGREAFRANEFYRQLADWEIAWTKQRHDLPVKPAGKPAEIAALLLKKYGPLLDRYYPPPGLEQGATATASAVQADYAAARAIDGRIDLGSFWGADPGPQWLQVDLQKPQRIGSVQVWPYWGDGRHYQYKVEVSSDGRQWTLVADMSQNTQPATEKGDLHTIKPVETRYVRVTMLKNSANPGVHIVEIKVMPAEEKQR
jgi:alpha-N-acetylglucosaminidase